MGTLTALAGRLLTPHGADRYLELVHPMLVRNEIRGEVTSVRRQTASTVTLTLRTSRAWRGFTAGQYVRVSTDIDGVRRTRCYSPACSQHRADGRLELTIKADPRGVVSRHLREHAVSGMVLGLSEPDGQFTLPARRPDRVLLISGGSGITPVLSIVRTLADEDHQGEVVLVHYTARPEDVPYRRELAALGARPNVRVVLGYTRAEGGDLRGHWSPGHLAAVAPWYRDAHTYLCGPGTLRDAVREHYVAEGLGEHLHTEEFTPSLPTTSGTAGGRVVFARSGKDIANSGKPLLEQAEAAGLNPEHGCRMGICLSCTQVKTSGTVRDAKSGATSGEENEEIQLCVSVPVGDVELDC